MTYRLLNINNNYKTIKNMKVGHLTGILYLAPAKMSGQEMCPARSLGCTASCLNTAGRGAFNATQRARIAKTKRFLFERDQFMADLICDLSALIRRAEREGLTPSVRLNGTSDIDWENVPVPGYRNLMEMFPDVQFYDYTKRLDRGVVERTHPSFRKMAGRPGSLPANYSLTFSLAEDNQARAQVALKRGWNLAVVFDSVPDLFMGRRVIDGDAHDLRAIDESGIVVGLTAKGKAKRDTTGFVVRCDALHALRAGRTQGSERAWAQRGTRQLAAHPVHARKVVVAG